VANDDVQHAYPLLGSIQNSVGYGFLGNEALTAIAHRMRVRTITVPTSYASARGGIDGRMTLTIDPRDFRRGVEFLVRQDPAVLVIGYLPRPEYVEIVASELPNYHGLVVLDPVLGSYEKGLYVSVETARAIRDRLLKHAQVVTPNRFEAEILLDLARDPNASERTFLETFAGRGPGTVIITSFTRDADRRQATTLFSNGHFHVRITSRFHPAFPAYGAGDTFAAALGVLLANSASPLAATLHASAIASLAVERTTVYGAASVDPVSALDVLKPLPYLDDETAIRYVERFGVTQEPISSGTEGGRTRLVPPRK